MARRDIVIGFIILVLVAGVVYIRQKNTSKKEEMKVPQTLSIQDTIEQKFNTQIPEDVEKAELKDVSGGTGSAIATRKFENGQFQLNILADLPDPEQGKFYEAWSIKGEEGKEGYSIVSLSKLSVAKGGWMLSFKSANDYTDHPKVLISLESKLDSTPEKHILEGSF